MAFQPRRDRGGNPGRLLPWRFRRRDAGSVVLLVAASKPAVAAAVRHAEHDPESGARSAVHRLVQLRHLSEHPDRLQHLLLSDPADHRARAERSRTRSIGPCKIAARVALDLVSQDPVAGRTALRVFWYEGRRHFGGCWCDRRRVHRFRARAWLSNDSGAVLARHAGHGDGSRASDVAGSGTLRPGAW